MLLYAALSVTMCETSYGDVRYDYDVCYIAPLCCYMLPCLSQCVRHHMVMSDMIMMYVTLRHCAVICCLVCHNV